MYGFGLCRSCIEDERAMRGNDGELGGRGVLGTCTEGKERAELEVVGGPHPRSSLCTTRKDTLRDRIESKILGIHSKPNKDLC